MPIPGLQSVVNFSGGLIRGALDRTSLADVTGMFARISNMIHLKLLKKNVDELRTIAPFTDDSPLESNFQQLNEGMLSDWDEIESSPTEFIHHYNQIKDLTQTYPDYDANTPIEGLLTDTLSAEQTAEYRAILEQYPDWATLNQFTAFRIMKTLEKNNKGDTAKSYNAISAQHTQQKTELQSELNQWFQACSLNFRAEDLDSAYAHILDLLEKFSSQPKISYLNKLTESDEKRSEEFYCKTCLLLYYAAHVVTIDKTAFQSPDLPKTLYANFTEQLNKSYAIHENPFMTLVISLSTLTSRKEKQPNPLLGTLIAYDKLTHALMTQPTPRGGHRQVDGLNLALSVLSEFSVIGKESLKVYQQGIICPQLKWTSPLKRAFHTWVYSVAQIGNAKRVLRQIQGKPEERSALLKLCFTALKTDKGLLLDLLTSHQHTKTKRTQLTALLGMAGVAHDKAAWHLRTLARLSSARPTNTSFNISNALDILCHCIERIHAMPSNSRLDDSLRVTLGILTQTSGATHSNKAMITDAILSNFSPTSKGDDSSAAFYGVLALALIKQLEQTELSGALSATTHVVGLTDAQKQFHTLFCCLGADSNESKDLAINFHSLITSRPTHGEAEEQKNIKAALLKAARILHILLEKNPDDDDSLMQTCVRIQRLCKLQNIGFLPASYVEAARKMTQEPSAEANLTATLGIEPQRMEPQKESAHPVPKAIDWTIIHVILMYGFRKRWFGQAALLRYWEAFHETIHPSESDFKKLIRCTLHMMNDDRETANRQAQTLIEKITVFKGLNISLIFTKIKAAISEYPSGGDSSLFALYQTICLAVFPSLELSPTDENPNFMQGLGNALKIFDDKKNRVDRVKNIIVLAASGLFTTFSIMLLATLAIVGVPVTLSLTIKLLSVNAAICFSGALIIKLIIDTMYKPECLGQPNVMPPVQSMNFKSTCQVARNFAVTIKKGLRGCLPQKAEPVAARPLA